VSHRESISSAPGPIERADSHVPIRSARESLVDAPPIADRAPDELEVDRTLSFLVALNDSLRPLRDANTIQREAVRLLGDRLAADRVYCCEFDRDFEHATIQVEYLRADLPSFVGHHPLGEFGAAVAALRSGESLRIEDLERSAMATPKGRQEYAAFGLRGVANVPIMRQGRLTAVLGVNYREPHPFGHQEIALISETAERMWDAVERARSDEALAAELADTKLLQTLSTELVAEEDSNALHEKIVDAALSIMRADFATFQMFHPERGEAGELQLLATSSPWCWHAPRSPTIP
jgi:GAF domain-containing protein